jgi:hypothetical protein
MRRIRLLVVVVLALSVLLAVPATAQSWGDHWRGDKWGEHDDDDKWRHHDDDDKWRDHDDGRHHNWWQPRCVWSWWGAGWYALWCKGPWGWYIAEWWTPRWW